MRSVTLFLSLLLVYSCNFSDYVRDLPGSYKYYDEGGSFKVIYGGVKNRSVIPCTVLRYKFNNDFIIAFQKAANKCHFPNEVEQELGISYYWIIDVKKDSLYRFSNQKKYLQKRRELGIPKKLQFE